jgi:hypothetical protein
MRPFTIYPRGNTLFINGGDCIHRYDGSRIFTDACASLSHICAISDESELCVGRLSDAGDVSDFSIHTDIKEIEAVSATTSSVYLLSLRGTLLFFEASMDPKDPWINMVPVASEVFVSFVKVQCGRRFVIAMDKSGGVWAYGQLGGTHYNRLTRIHQDVIDFSCGDFHVILLQEDGTLMSYGEDKHVIEPESGTSRFVALGKKNIIIGA